MYLLVQTDKRRDKWFTWLKGWVTPRGAPLLTYFPFWFPKPLRARNHPNGLVNRVLTEMYKLEQLWATEVCSSVRENNDLACILVVLEWATSSCVLITLPAISIRAPTLKCSLWVRTQITTRNRSSKIILLFNIKPKNHFPVAWSFIKYGRLKVLL